jgi:hypothetical protein
MKLQLYYDELQSKVSELFLMVQIHRDHVNGTGCEPQSAFPLGQSIACPGPVTG